MIAAEGLPAASSLHPASLILIWLGFALCIPWLRVTDLAAIAGLLLMPMLFGRSPEYLKLLRRTRWLLLSLFMIYAFATPGATLVPAFGSYSPSREGVWSGGIQALRLVTLLAGLALLLTTFSRERFLAGLYHLLRPITLLGVNVDRAAARIWLTLHYAEQKEAGRPGDWGEKFRLASEGAGDGEGQTVSFDVRHFCWPDYLALALGALMLGLLVGRGAA